VQDKPIGWDGIAGSGPRIVTVAATWTQLCVANSRRTALILPSAQAETLLFGLEIGVEDNWIIATVAGGAPVVLSRHLHGGLVTRAWFVFGTVGGSFIRVGEAFN